MPNLYVTETAVQIAQSLGQGVHIQNNGNVPVYLDEDSACSVGSYGMKVGAGGTANWPAGKTLWAACAPGESSSIALLYGAFGATVTDVKAEVTNPLTVSDILAPVSIQGGGEFVTSQTSLTTIPQGGGTYRTPAVVIPALVNGLTYQGLFVRVTLLTTVPGRRMSWILQASGIEYSGTLLADADGYSAQHAFSIPCNGPLPWQFLAYADAADTEVQVTVYAQASVLPYAVTVRENWPGAIDFPAGTTTVHTLPVSYNSYDVEIQPLGTSTITATSGNVLQHSGGVFTSTLFWSNSHLSPEYTFASVVLSGNNKGRIRVPGDGLAHNIAMAVSAGLGARAFIIPPN